MFARVVFTFLLIQTTSVHGQLRSAPWNEEQGYLPYGTMRVNEKLIADQTEITVGEWLGYIVSICDTDRLRVQRPLRKMSAEDKQYLLNFRYPDSLLPEARILQTLSWRMLIDSANNYVLYKMSGSNWPQTIPINSEYFVSQEKRKQLDRFLVMPITGISFEQAIGFCNWRTEVDSIRSVSDWQFPHCIFRLPSIAEFNAMNQQFDSTITKSRHFSIRYGYKASRIGFNYRNVSATFLSKSSRSNDIQEVWEYDPDNFGFYGIQGNAAEMTSRQGAACGGSYFHYAIECYRYQIQVYDHPERWLGFRCVAELK